MTRHKYNWNLNGKPKFTIQIAIAQETTPQDNEATRSDEEYARF